MKKRCIKCGIEKPIIEFYRHSEMKDGYVNKCKECTKKETRLRYNEKSHDETWVESQRARGREKYKRLNYKSRPFSNKTYKDFHIVKTISRNLRAKGFNTTGLEAHHWNYNLPKSVILLSRKAHHRIHKYITVNREDKYCYTLFGECLNTEEKTIKYYKEVLNQYSDFKENLTIINL